MLSSRERYIAFPVDITYMVNTLRATERLWILQEIIHFR